MSSHTCHLKCSCAHLLSDFLIFSDVTLDGDYDNGSEEEDAPDMIEPALIFNTDPIQVVPASSPVVPSPAQMVAAPSPVVTNPIQGKPVSSPVVAKFKISKNVNNNDMMIMLMEQNRRHEDANRLLMEQLAAHAKVFENWKPQATATESRKTRTLSEPDPQDKSLWMSGTYTIEDNRQDKLCLEVRMNKYTWFPIQFVISLRSA